MTALSDLAQQRQWVMWRNEPRGNKTTKVPYFKAPRFFDDRQHMAQSDNPATWLLHAESALLAETFVNGSGGGTGIMLGARDNLWLAGVDLDSCRDPATGAILPWAQQVLDRLGTYAEVSPSETGIKAFFLLKPAVAERLRPLLSGDGKNSRYWRRPDGSDHSPAIELHIDRRYFAVTWEGLENAPTEMRTVPFEDLLWLIDEGGPSFSGKPNSSSESGSGADTADDILGRLNRLARSNRAVDAAIRNAATMHGGSRSEGAFGLGAALKRAGWAYADMKAALLACPATKEWATEKLPEGERQFERIWQHASSDGDDKPVQEAHGGSRDDPKAPIPLRVVNPADLDGRSIPERRWIVADWLPIGCVTGQYGDGGVGKGMSAQQGQTACATGTPWFDLAVMRCPSLGFYSEDDEDELHRRQDRICHAFSLRFGDLADMRWISGVGQDNTLCTFDAAGRMHVTDRWYQVREAALSHHARLIVLDNAADLFGGNENDRGQVRRFIGLLGRLGIDCDAAVLLNCHPSRSGLASGNLDGASTAWHNSMRSRWTLARTKDDEGQDDGERTLRRAKANYAPDGGIIRLRWAGGVLVPVTRDGGIAGAASRAACEEVFLMLLDRSEVQGTAVSESPNAGNYAPKVFARRPDREGYLVKDFERAMHALFAANGIHVTEYRRTNRCTGRRISRLTATTKDAA